MKRLTILIFYWTFFSLIAFPQWRQDDFRISIEDNWQDNQPNLESKGELERLFFGDFNAPIEFLYEPDRRGASGFRIVRDSLELSYILELKYISNHSEAAAEASRRYPSIGVRNPSDIPNDIANINIAEHNRKAFAKRRKARLKLFETETLSFPISNQFAEKLQEKMQIFIDTFEEEVTLPETERFCAETNRLAMRFVRGGYTVTFRTVVDDEVWALHIRNPLTRALEWSNLFRQIIAEAKVGEFDEEKYMSILSTLGEKPPPLPAW